MLDHLCHPPSLNIPSTTLSDAARLFATLYCVPSHPSLAPSNPTRSLSVPFPRIPSPPILGRSGSTASCPSRPGAPPAPFPLHPPPSHPGAGLLSRMAMVKLSITACEALARLVQRYRALLTWSMLVFDKAPRPVRAAETAMLLLAPQQPPLHARRLPRVPGLNAGQFSHLWTDHTQ